MNSGLAAALLLCKNKGKIAIKSDFELNRMVNNVLLIKKNNIHLTLSGLLDTQMQKVARVKAPKAALPEDNYCIEDKM